MASPLLAHLVVAFSCAPPRHAPTRTATPRLAATAATAKEALLSAVAAYDQATKADGVPSVDFGVSGGELDADSRACAVQCGTPFACASLPPRPTDLSLRVPSSPAQAA